VRLQLAGADAATQFASHFVDAIEGGKSSLITLPVICMLSDKLPVPVNAARRIARKFEEKN
jgi:hypothetical protein